MANAAPSIDWRQIAHHQDGVIARRQLLGQLSPRAISWAVTSGRWRQVRHGVYAVFTGPLPWRAQAWAAVLAAGDGAVLAGPAALYLHGVHVGGPAAEPPAWFDVAIPAARRAQPQPGLTLRRRNDLLSSALMTASPPRLRVPEAAIDHAARSPTPGTAVGVVLAVVQHRRAQPNHLLNCLAARPRHPWRRALEEALADSTDGGALTPLELAFMRLVSRPHGLPQGAFNAADRECDVFGVDRGQRYRDLKYRRYALVIELDGRLGHTWADRRRDDRRDNRLLVSGVTTMRYGWHEVNDLACETAAEIGAVLLGRGWSGRLRRCGPACRVTKS